MNSNIDFQKGYFEGKNSNYKKGYFLDKEREHIFNFFINEFLSNISFTNILDIGCATGIFLHVLQKKYPNTKLFGVDVSDYGIQTCRNNLTGIFKVYDVNKSKIPFKKKFDLITSFELIEHLFNEDNYLKNINYSLKKGAFFLFSCPMKSGLIRRMLDKDTTHINLHDSRYYLNIMPRYGFHIKKYKQIALWSKIPTVNLRNFLNYRGNPIETSLDLLTQDQIYLCRKNYDIYK